MEVHVNLFIDTSLVRRDDCEWQPAPFSLEMTTRRNKSVVNGSSMGIVKDENRVSVIIGFDEGVGVISVGTG